MISFLAGAPAAVVTFSRVAIAYTGNNNKGLGTDLSWVARPASRGASVKRQAPGSQHKLAHIQGFWCAFGRPRGAQGV